MTAEEGHKCEKGADKERCMPEDAPIRADDQAPEALPDGRGEAFAAVEMIACIEGAAEAGLVVPEQQSAAD